MVYFLAHPVKSLWTVRISKLQNRIVQKDYIFHQLKLIVTIPKMLIVETKKK